MSGSLAEIPSTTLNAALTAAVERWPGATFLKVSGRDVTFAEFDEEVGRLAAGLAQAGLGRGDRLGVFMSNSLACLHTWFAANRLGASWAPVNTEFRGLPLHHVVDLADPKRFVCDAELLSAFQAAFGDQMQSRLIVHTEADATDLPAPALSTFYAGEPLEPEPVEPSDTAALLFTSGTTGRSKACVLSHQYFITQASIVLRDFGLRQDDTLYCPFPLFHADATALTTVPALILGCTAAIGKRFSASRFWEEIADTGATVFDFMGATLSILWKAEARPDDANNPVRLAWGVPVPDWAPEFEKRFGLQIVELYGSVEASIPVTQRHDTPRIVGSCGRAVPEFEVTVTDDQDLPVAPGETGEILVRPNAPSIILDGYFGMPEATAEAFRNLWFHTGDLGRLDAEGNLFFVGRKKDVIRRRGENISAFELEEGVLLHPDVIEVAAIGVPSDLGEEDVKVCVVARPDSDLTADEVVSHCRKHLARFQVPRYVELVADVPKTPTGKFRKNLLKEEGLTPTTRDYGEGRRPAAAASARPRGPRTRGGRSRGRG